MSIAEAEEAVMALLKEHMTKGAIIAGNSVHHDMRFIRREMPMVSDYCTFRIIDISSFQGSCSRESPEWPSLLQEEDTQPSQTRGGVWKSSDSTLRIT